MNSEENNQEEEVVVEEPTVEEEDTISIPKTEYDKLNQTVGSLKREVKILKKPRAEETKTGELDENQLDFLDIKGITDPDEISVIQKVVTKTGQTVRQALKDDYVLAKLEALRKEKSVKDATPSGTKRGGSQTNDLNTALARFDQTGELPDDFKLKSEVVNAIADRSNTNKPAWH